MFGLNNKNEKKLSMMLGTMVFTIDDKFLSYRSTATSFRILKSDIDSVSIDSDPKMGLGHIGYNYLRVNGRGTLLGEAHLPQSNARKAQEFILKEINLNANKSAGNNNYDDLEKLADLKEKGIITQEEFEAKKKQILGL